MTERVKEEKGAEAEERENSKEEGKVKREKGLTKLDI